MLSGLLLSQGADVLAAHRRQGLALDFALHLGDWSVLVLKKPRRRDGRSTKAKRRPQGRARPKSKT